MLFISKQSLTSVRRGYDPVSCIGQNLAGDSAYKILVLDQQDFPSSVRGCFSGESRPARHLVADLYSLRPHGVPLDRISGSNRLSSDQASCNMQFRYHRPHWRTRSRAARKSMKMGHGGGEKSGAGQAVGLLIPFISGIVLERGNRSGTYDCTALAVAATSERSGSSRWDRVRSCERLQEPTGETRIPYRRQTPAPAARAAFRR